MAHTDLSAFLSRPAEGFYTSEVPASQERRGGGWPLRTFLPTGYEPNYPYPLLVFLHGHGGSEEQVLRHAPQLSRRNYICIGLRGPRPLGLRDNGLPAYAWDAEGHSDVRVEEYVFRAIEQTRRHYHVHSERIYLAGLHEGATLAYRLGLTYPERFAGLIALNGVMPRRGGPLLRLPEVRHLRVLIGHGAANEIVPLEMARQDFRLLYTAGLSIRLHTYPANHGIHRDMLRDINRWVMQAIHDEERA
ncbi:MAG TPA: PHB depolymerase family esterase [Gemmataceae bacterium]|jgi:phospholipase/carboxylesterase